MREALRGLTTRGRSFLAAGGAAALSALILGEKDLLRVAVLLAVLASIATIIIRVDAGSALQGIETAIVIACAAVALLAGIAAIVVGGAGLRRATAMKG